MDFSPILEQDMSCVTWVSIFDLRYNKRADAFLQYGWVVERHLKDGE
jgi:hypothetical protein